MELLRFLFHPFLQSLHQVLVLSFKEHPHLVHDLLILDRIDLPTAWTSTSVHLVIDAWSQTMGEFGVEAGPDRKEPSDQFQGLLKRSGRRVRAKVDRAIFLNPPHNAQGWKFLFH